jgi:hypothetical protein
MFKLLAVSGGNREILEPIFWVLLILMALAGGFIPDSQPYAHRGRFIFVIVLIAILGLRIFGNPAS